VKRHHDGSVGRAREFAKTVEHFSAAELAVHLGKTARAAQQTITYEHRAHRLIGCGPRGGTGLRRYTIHPDVAARIDAEAAPKPLSEQGMRRKIGACLGGLSDDIESLRVRCDIADDDPDTCWLWTGAMTGSSSPIPTAQLPGGNGGGSVRRWVHETFKGPVAPGHIVWCKCGHNRCLNLTHFTSGTRQQWGAWVRKTGAWSGLSTYMVSNRKAGLARAVITAEVLADIESRGERTVDAAARLGVAPSSISRARRKSNVATVPHASIFSMRAGSKLLGAMA
jgi:hypothetical protein